MTCSYSDEIERSAGKFNISLCQSYENFSYNKIINVSKLGFNKFNVSSPNDIHFNSSYMNITIGKISAYSYNKILEDDPFVADESVLGIHHAVSFNVTGDCYLDNVSVEVYVEGTPTLSAYLLESTWNSSESRSDPVTASITLLGTFSSPSTGWNTLELSTPKFLNTSTTENNTWFVDLRASGDTVKWRLVPDSDNGDNSHAYYLSGYWVHQAYDYNCHLDLLPINNTPHPDDIGLKINNDAVSGYTGVNGSGYWESTNVYGSDIGEIEFEVTADWYNIEVNISQFQVNYTKIGKIDSLIKSIPDNNIQWIIGDTNILNLFDPRFNIYNVINFTVPEMWNIINVFNGTLNKTDVIYTRFLNNGYKDIVVSQVGNGENWFLTSITQNLLQKINVIIKQPLDPPYYATIQDSIEFNSEFTHKLYQNDGKILLKIYNSEKMLISSKITSIFQADSHISLDTWKAEEYGIYYVQVSWYNSTDAGLGETKIEILEYYPIAPFPFEILILFIGISGLIFTVLIFIYRKKKRLTNIDED